jgi:ATP-dependent Clp protease protease subunit
VPPPSPQKIVYVNFFGAITDAVAAKFMQACQQILAAEKPDVLYFLFASAGGSVEGGVAMYNYLRALPVKIVMHNNGSIDSIANVIFHAADERKAAPHTTFLFHGVAMTLGTNPTLNRSQIQELLSQISALEGKIANILIGRCGLTLPEIQNLFLNGETKHTAFALDKGIIQEVGQPLIPKDAKFYSLNFT